MTGKKKASRDGTCCQATRAIQELLSNTIYAPHHAQTGACCQAARAIREWLNADKKIYCLSLDHHGTDCPRGFDARRFTLLQSVKADPLETVFLRLARMTLPCLLLRWVQPRRSIDVFNSLAPEVPQLTP